MKLSSLINKFERMDLYRNCCRLLHLAAEDKKHRSPFDSLVRPAFSVNLSAKRAKCENNMKDSDNIYSTVPRKTNMFGSTQSIKRVSSKWLRRRRWICSRNFQRYILLGITCYDLWWTGRCSWWGKAIAFKFCVRLTEQAANHECLLAFITVTFLDNLNFCRNLSSVLYLILEANDTNYQKKNIISTTENKENLHTESLDVLRGKWRTLKSGSSCFKQVREEWSL